MNDLVRKNFQQAFWIGMSIVVVCVFCFLTDLFAHTNHPGPFLSKNENPNLYIFFRCYWIIWAFSFCFVLCVFGFNKKTYEYFLKQGNFSRAVQYAKILSVVLYFFSGFYILGGISIFESGESLWDLFDFSVFALISTIFSFLISVKWRNWFNSLLDPSKSEDLPWKDA